MKTTIAPTASGDGVTLPPDVLRASGLKGEVNVTVEPGRVVITNGPAGLPHETTEERAERGRKMREALDKLGETGAFASIEDPVAWQREIRKDRPRADWEEAFADMAQAQDDVILVPESATAFDEEAWTW